MCWRTLCGGTRLTVTISFPRKMADLKPTSGDLYAECRNILPGMSVEQTKQIEAAIKAGNFLEAASVVQAFKNLSGIDFNIAVTGESGSGKSSLVNAIRGLGDEDEGAAETRVVKMTKEPVPYCHPTCPMMFVWDLPAIGTPGFQVDAYLKQVKFSRYNIFIIIATERTRFCHTKLAREIQKMGKKYYFVRSKVDLDLYNEESNESFNEERTLEKIRNDCVNNLSRVGVSSPQIFLVSSREFQKYDSPQLQKTLLKEFFNHKTNTFRATEAPRSSGKMADLKPTSDDLYAEYRNILPGMSVEQTTQIEAAIKAGNFLDAASVVQTFKNLSGIEFNIAITGESGSGKSSLVNAIRGLEDEDEGAAETGVLEVTKEPAPYCHPTCPMVTFWDLPMIGSPDFQPDAYLKEVKFSRYDVFIIIASERSRFCHTKLAQEITRMGKNFYFVRSKVDLDLYNEKHKKSFNEERTLEKIRNDCVNNLSREGINSPQIFLVSSREFQKYDSLQLQKTLLKELYNHKTETFGNTEAPRDSGEMADLKPTCDDLYAEYRNILPGISAEQTKQIEAAIKAGNFLEAASVLQTFKNLSGIEFNVAIMGESGSGKSSLVNAIRGLGDRDKGAAETGVLQMTKKPVPYHHPTCPMAIFWDLPAIGTPDFRPDAYLKQVKFRRYDVFIIIVSERSRFCLTELAREIHRMGKKVFFVRSRVDLDLYTEKHKKSFNEGRTLEKIRTDCIKKLLREGISPLEVFLLSRREFQKYDSPQLQKTLLKELYNHKMETFRANEAPRSSRIAEDSKNHWAGLFSKWSSKLPGLSEDETEQFQMAVKAGNFSRAFSVVKKSDELLTNIKINIAITGNTGSGKSSFINVIRTLNDDDRGAAETGRAEKKKTPYSHPKHPNVILWDLPGIGTANCPAETYLKDMNFDQYDFIIIIAAGRFTEADTNLAKEISSMGKMFYFVRSKVDVDLANEQRKRDFKEEKTLQEIRSDCMEQLQKAGIISPQVFLVSRWHFDKYDFPRLQEVLANDLDIHKRHVLICALPSTSAEILKEKQKALQEQIWKQALKSCALAAVPLPFLSVKCDVNILVENMRQYCQFFGLDEDSLQSLAKQVGKPVAELKSVIKSPLVKDITREEALKRLREATGKALNSSTDPHTPGSLGQVQPGLKGGRSRWSRGAELSLKMEQLKFIPGNKFAKDRNILPGVSEKETEEIKAALEAGDLSGAAYLAQKSDELFNNTELNIAITGESGAGKSSFLNALRGLGDEDKGSAETGVIETTKEPKPYKHFKYPNVIFWDLPGIGTPEFRPDTYLEQVKFDRYDFFIIIASERFRANHTKLAQEIRRMGKKFYFVRSKVDFDLYNEKRKQNFDEEKTLEKIRNDCIKYLSREGMSCPKVFLVSSREFQKYDSPKLQKKLLKELESHKKHIFLLALPNLSQPILEKKKKALQRQIWKQALKSCAIAAVPLPALSVKCDVGILVDNMRAYCESFGLDDMSLKVLASQVRKPVAELKDVIKSPLAKEISKETAKEQLTKATGKGLILAKHFISMIPVAGTIFAAERSFTVTYRMLNSFLDDVAEDAQRVLIKALERENK
ncbi:uncharacterized protein RBU57_016755 [Macrochelys suwanniensis]